MRQYPDVDAAFALQQIEGWQRARTKLPELAATNGWWWPVRLSMEQCSSQDTALYKTTVLSGTLQRLNIPADSLCDLTGGFGIDTYYLSRSFREAHYVERQEALCRIAEHNFALTNRHVCIHNTQAETFLHEMSACAAIFIDPARRDSHGGKVFRLEDCEPNVVELLPMLRHRCSVLMLKLSPMLDITEALRQLPEASEVHIVAVQNEVKEVLVVCRMHDVLSFPTYTCANLQKETVELFHFTQENENMAKATLVDQLPDVDFYLYEPNSAILKAGAYKLLGTRYGVHKLAPNSHLYLSNDLVPDFPGRTFRVHVADKEELKHINRANIICRNHPLRPEELKKKLKVKDGGETYIIGTRAKDKAVILAGERLT